MIMDDKHQLAGDPLRTPDWRARTAAMLAAELRNPSPRLYDSKTRSLVELLTQRSREEVNPRRPARLPPQLLCVSSAWTIREAVAGSLRYAIEAQLLTERSPEAIAVAVGIPLDVITWYADLYFDVADRLQAPRSS